MTLTIWGSRDFSSFSTLLFFLFILFLAIGKEPYVFYIFVVVVVGFLNEIFLKKIGQTNGKKVSAFEKIMTYFLNT